MNGRLSPIWNSSLIDKAITSVRTLSIELSPSMVEDGGLAAAFEWLVNHLKEIHHLNVELKVQGNGQVLSNDLQIMVRSKTIANSSGRGLTHFDAAMTHLGELCYSPTGLKRASPKCLE